MITNSFWGHKFIWKLNESYETYSSEDAYPQFCLQFNESTCILKMLLLPGRQHHFNIFSSPGQRVIMTLFFSFKSKFPIMLAPV